MNLPKRIRGILLFLVSILLISSLWLLSSSPSNDRDWLPEYKVIPRVSVDGEIVRISHVRNMDHSVPEPVPAYEDRVYDLNKLSSLWFAVVPFGDEWRGPAHVMLSFGFEGGDYLAASVEARRETGDFSALKGLFRRYGLIYVLGDERDVVQLRFQRGDDVYLYPVRIEKADLRALFLDVLGRAEGLADRPEFYNTLFNSCASNVLRHANAVRLRRIPSWHIRALLPGYSDRLAHDLGIIDSNLPLEEVRQKFLANPRAPAGRTPDFSARIRASPDSSRP